MPSPTETPARLDAPAPTPARSSPLDLLFETIDFVTGLGMFVMALSPLAIPGVLLVVVPLIVLGLAGALVVAVLAVPVVLVRGLTLAARRARGPREPVVAAGPTELAR